MQDLFFYSSKIIWMLVAPDNLLLILMTLSVILLYSRFYSFARKIIGILLLFTWVLAFFPLGQWLLLPLERQFSHNPELPQRVDGIILLGGSIMPSMSAYWQQLETNEAHERIDYFTRLAKQFPEARLVFTGGNASLQRGKPSEAAMLHDYLLRSGLDSGRLYMESESRNTHENAVFSRRLVKPHKDENWLLITSAGHMNRAVGVFCQQDWPVIPYPVDHRTLPDEIFQPGLNLANHLAGLSLASHEWAGLLAYYLSGKTPQILTRECLT